MSTDNNKTVYGKSTAETLYGLTKTPYLSAFNMLMLLSTPMISPALVDPTILNKSLTFNKNSLKSFLFNSKYIGPTNKSCILFGMAQGLGSWMISDDDIESGSGFLFAWSTLYLVVSGKNSLRALKYGKVWPLGLSGVSLMNSLLFGKRFVSCQFN